ncbi:hypothetical protein EV363DRAFT_1349681, partial [Boletus edulis]
MHPAFLIDEILLHIFSYCYNPFHPFAPGRRWYYETVHLTALARVCKTFKDPALDMIWAELDDLTPLVRCLPESSRAESLEGAYSLRKLLEQNEWDIILGYARRVRALRSLRGSSGLDAECIRALCNSPTSVESIFPNLRVVVLYEPSATIVPFLRHLTHPKLEKNWFKHTKNLGVAIEAFGEGCPIITDFHVSGWAHVDTISDLICRWENLRSVRCYDVGLNADAVTHLSHLRKLRYMAFEVHDAVVDRIPAIPACASVLPFSALHDIYLASDSLIPICRILRRFYFPEVHSFLVALYTRPTAPNLMSFFVALQEACAHRNSLDNLSLCVRDTKNKTPLEDASSYYITFDRLRPLTVFTNIKSITLDISCGTDLNERELLCLASSWPRLETAISPGGFLQLLERCRSLRVLYFMLDTRGYTEIPQGHPWRGLTMPKDSFIHLLNSPIEEESIEALSVFFHASPYPDFDLTTHWNNRYYRGSERPQELCDLYYERWVRARSLAHDLWKARRDLSRSLQD